MLILPCSTISPESVPVASVELLHGWMCTLRVASIQNRLSHANTMAAVRSNCSRSEEMDTVPQNSSHRETNQSRCPETFPVPETSAPTLCSITHTDSECGSFASPFPILISRATNGSETPGGGRLPLAGVCHQADCASPQIGPCRVHY